MTKHIRQASLEKLEDAVNKRAAKAVMIIFRRRENLSNAFRKVLIVASV